MDEEVANIVDELWDKFTHREKVHAYNAIANMACVSYKHVDMLTYIHKHASTIIIREISILDDHIGSAEWEDEEQLFRLTNPWFLALMSVIKDQS
tara:strand:+ start:218 stop:502 length:285 start_codon:yes stop_codon:yes gene_type:complete